jgi:hypothetical protein
MVSVTCASAVKAMKAYAQSERIILLIQQLSQMSNTRARAKVGVMNRGKGYGQRNQSIVYSPHDTPPAKPLVVGCLRQLDVSWDHKLLQQPGQMDILDSLTWIQWPISKISFRPVRPGYDC